MESKDNCQVSFATFRQFIFNLLCKRKRRRNLMLQWHTRMPFKGATLDEVFKQFLECILHSPIQFVILSKYISCFGGKLLIPFTWLTPTEKSMVTMMVKHKNELFKKIVVLESDEVCMQQCVYDKRVTESYAIENRRELIRDFVHYLMYVQKEYSNELCKYFLQRTCLKIISKSKEVDRFVLELHHVLQTGKIQNILTFY